MANGERRSWFDNVVTAVEATDANTAVIYVSAPSATDAIDEAIYAKIRLIVCITEGISVLDMIKIAAYLRHIETRLIGPNCPGLLTPAQTKVGIIPGFVARPGKWGLFRAAVRSLTIQRIGCHKPKAQLASWRPLSVSAAIRWWVRVLWIFWKCSRTIPTPMLLC